MSYINTSSIPINYYGLTTLRCPKFSKILHVHITQGNTIKITYSSELFVSQSDDKVNGTGNYKSINFMILSGLHFDNVKMAESFEYFSTIRTEFNDIIEFNYIFIENIKTLDERRESTLIEVLDHQH